MIIETVTSKVDQSWSWGSQEANKRIKRDFEACVPEKKEKTERILKN